MSLFSLKELKKSSVYLTPNFPSLQTKRYKFSFFRVFSVILIFSLIVALITTAILVFTPAKNVLFFVENDKLKEKADQIEELENRVAILTNQLNSISSTTTKLKYAMLLGEIDSVDSNTRKIYDSLKKKADPEIKISPEGNVYKAFLLFVDNLWRKDSNGVEDIFISPVDGVIINNFEADKGHLGVDFALKNNSPVYASEAGIVIFSGYDIDDGFTIILSHKNNYISKYKHCAQLLVNERETVEQGELIARSGNSGYNTSGPHLHFEIWKDGFAVNPEKYLTLEGDPNGK